MRSPLHPYMQRGHRREVNIPLDLHGRNQAQIKRNQALPLDLHGRNQAQIKRNHAQSSAIERNHHTVRGLDDPYVVERSVRALCRREGREKGAAESLVSDPTIRIEGK